MQYGNSTALTLLDALGLDGTLHLPSLPTIVYTIPRNRPRQQRVAKMLESLGFKQWSFLQGKEGGNPYWRSIYPDFIPLMDRGCPFLFLEDDIQLIAPNYTPYVRVPKGAQAIYLGGTSNGDFSFIRELRRNCPNLRCSNNHGGHIKTPMHFTDYDSDYIRVYNMHSTHAILFLDPAWCRHLKGELRRMQTRTAVDVVCAREQRAFKILCLKRPFWFQADGHNDRVTQAYYPRP